MGIYRCSSCGSKNVDIDIREEGYNIKKGFLGTFLFGTGGAVMGLNANEKKYYHCRDCGETRTYCLSDEETIRINKALLDKKNTFKLDTLKKIYPNIEYEKKVYSSADIEELANKIYTYCKEQNIRSVEQDMLEEQIDCGDLNNLDNALEILEKRGVAEYDFQKSRSNSGLWYKFCLTEKDFENKAIRDGKLDDEILANKIYQYCKENYITKQTKEKIFEAIADGDISNGENALFVLKERGLVKKIASETECYYEIFLDEEKIKLEKERLRIANGELSNEELANNIYKFCKEKDITYIEKDELDFLIAGKWIKNGFEALELLEKRGFVKRDENEETKFYYRFYIDESAIKENKDKKFIRDGDLSDEELADKLYQYCKENNIFYIKEEDLYSAIADGWIVNGKRALWVLEQKGLAELEFEIKDENSYYKFHYTTEEIEKAKQNPLLNTEYLANKIYQYCKENNITQVSNKSMEKTVIGGHVDNYEQAFIILQKKGLLEIEDIENEDDIFDIKYEYKFYFTEKEMQELKDRTLCIMDEELADKIYQYCKENKITSIYNYELEEAFSNGYIIPNFYEAINILINRKKVKDDVGLFIISI